MVRADLDSAVIGRRAKNPTTGFDGDSDFEKIGARGADHHCGNYFWIMAGIASGGRKLAGDLPGESSGLGF